jgi:hypothetical protein
MNFIVALLCSFAMASEPEHDVASFGTDVSIGYGLGTALTEDLDPTRYGNILFRYDAFVRDRTTTGPRIGFGLWGAMTVGPTPSIKTMQADGSAMRHEAPMVHTGIMALLRHDPEAPIGGTFGMGFGRLEFESSPTDKIAMPALTIEAGGRHTTGGHGFIDWMLRTHWATHTDTDSLQLEDWWFIELSTSIGMHLR